MQYAMNAFRIERRIPMLRGRPALIAIVTGVLVWLVPAPLPAAERSVPAATVVAEENPPPPSRGLDLLLSRAYLPADLDQQVFDDLWTVWEEPARSRAEQAELPERRRMTRERYGLTPHPDDHTRSMQYVVDPASGSWTMSCLACHQGQVDGRVIPGLPNSNYALETLTEEVRLVKVKQRKPFGHMDMGSLFLPLGTTNGTTNAVMFGVALMRHRDPDLSIVQRPPRFDLVHHDMDAPAWWHYAKRRSLYADGFAPKGHRILMQFLLVKENGPEKFHAWEDEFRDIERWIESLEAPRWPWAVESSLAEKGRAIFLQHCADCHGTYDPVEPARETYPDRIVDIAEVGTDRVRFDSLTAKERGELSMSWFGHMGADAVAIKDRESPAGYVAPPLDGIWATAPYLHNGSVPTLWHLLHPADRPAVWKRTPTGYDQARVGLEVTEMEKMPAGSGQEKLSSAERRRHFDTSKPGKSAKGHDFPDALDEEEKTAVLEYLKTL
jgi:mono/diheme cytochrome c family protein